MKYIGITGGTGLIGKYLSKLLADDGYQIIIFTRSPNKKRKYIKNTSYALWNPNKKQIDTAELAKIHAMIHLAGTSIAGKRWTEQRKTEILDSRVLGTKFIVQQLKQHAPNCKVFVANSAIGYYGADKSDTPFTEISSPANDFLARTCIQWEAASENAEDYTRRVILRMGIVLGKSGGVFHEFNKPMNWGFMPILGDGEQTVSWIHVHDAARLIRLAIERTEFDGIYNAVAPLPVTHADLVHTMARVKGGIKVPIPVPSAILKLIMGEMSIEVLKSTTVSCKKITDKGFRFEFRDIESAIKNLTNKN